jgi:hypothetical protein
VDASNEHVENVFEILSTVSMMTTSFLMQEHQRNNETYPHGFVTIPNAEYHLARARHETGAHVLAYAPTVEGKDYALWSQYVEKNLRWLDEARDVNHRRIEQGALVEQVYSHVDVERQIWSVVDPYNSSVCYGNHAEDVVEFQVQLGHPEDGPASPIWTISPPPKPDKANRINYDMSSSKVFQTMTNTVATHRHATFHDTCEFTGVSSMAARSSLSMQAISVCFSKFANVLNVCISSLTLSRTIPWSTQLFLHRFLAASIGTRQLSVTTLLLYRGMCSSKDFPTKQLLLLLL